MITVTVDGLDWPVLEPKDFIFTDYNETFHAIEDEAGDRFFGYGHIPGEEFLAEVRRYITHMAGEEYEHWPAPDSVRHLYAKATDSYGERFTWKGVTADTPHAFPMTVLDL